MTHEADALFKHALRLWPTVVDSPSRRHQRRLMDEIVKYGGGWNAVKLRLGLNDRLREWREWIRPNSAARQALRKYLISRGLVVGFGAILLLLITWMVSCFEKGGH